MFTLTPLRIAALSLVLLAGVLVMVASGSLIGAWVLVLVLGCAVVFGRLLALADWLAR